MDVEKDLAELDTIINRVSVVEKFAIWETIDDLLNNRDWRPLSQLTPDSAKARRIIAPFEWEKEHWIHLHSLHDRLHTLIKEAVKDMSAIQRDAVFRWQHASGYVVEFVPPPFFFD